MSGICEKSFVVTFFLFFFFTTSFLLLAAIVSAVLFTHLCIHAHSLLALLVEQDDLGLPLEYLK